MPSDNFLKRRTSTRRTTNYSYNKYLFRIRINESISFFHPAIMDAAGTFCCRAMRTASVPMTLSNIFIRDESE